MATKTKDEKQDATSETAVAAGKLQPAVPSMAELADMEAKRVQSGIKGEIHLWREGTFLRAYDWSAWLAFRLLHEFKVNKRQLKGREKPVAYIGFPETSLQKWLPEGIHHEVLTEKHMVLTMTEEMLAALGIDLEAEYMTWYDSLPLTETRDSGKRVMKVVDNSPFEQNKTNNQVSMVAIMQRILAYPIESNSPMECMLFLADVKQQLAALF